MNVKALHVEVFAPGDIADAIALWLRTEGLGLGQSDTPQAVTKFLAHNPGFSFIARSGAVLVGAVLCGHDGRRGYVHHLAVDPEHRRRGIGRRLLAQSLARLNEAGIPKCHAFVFQSNPCAELFWAPAGWTLREDLLVYSNATQP
jgi:ribosomal protein S18 acetylase RimI-like enzyme